MRRRQPCAIARGRADRAEGRTPRVLGRKLFADNCAACHGDDGKGNQGDGCAQPGRRISTLYGMDMASLTETITNSRNGVMPAWGGRLDRRRSRH